ncbi:MAG: hypothetical protein E6Q76_05590 [Rhizobium sp.]|nr:MAG: hypothetical protein E6Q76_05590 [Rhizobium sp.]
MNIVKRLALIGLCIGAVTAFSADAATNTCSGGTYQTTQINVPVGTSQSASSYMMCIPTGATGVINQKTGGGGAKINAWYSVTCPGDGTMGCATAYSDVANSSGGPNPAFSRVAPQFMLGVATPTAQNTFNLKCNYADNFGGNSASQLSGGYCQFSCMSPSQY